MRFLANENIPIDVVNDLRKLGYDILRVDEVKKGMKDNEVLDISLKEERILITFDKDFGELVIKDKRKANGVILLRMAPKSAIFIKERLITLFSQISELERKFIILKEDIIRERSL